MKRIATYVFWLVGLALLAYGAVFSTYAVLDKPLSSEAVTQGVTMDVYNEFEMTNAVSTDRIELTDEGILKTRPDVGFCES